MTRSRFVLPALCSLACLAGLLHPPVGHAGAYYVRACHGDGINAVWAPAYTANTTAYVQCPGGVNGNAGLVVRNVHSATPAPGYSNATLSVGAPAGTYIDNIQYTAQVYNNANWQSGLYDKQHGAWLWCGPSCGTLPIWSGFNLGGFATTHLQMLTICAATQCGRDGTHGAVMLRDVTLRLQDVWNPAVSIVGGSLASGGWKRGVQTVEVAGSDNTGIRVERVFADGQLKNFQSSACDDHALVPCPASVRGTLEVNTQQLSDGQHSLAVETEDAGGNVSADRRTFFVDNTPPDPAQMLATDTEEWRSVNGFKAHWTNPPQGAGSPIAGAAHQICVDAGTSQGCEPVQRTSAAEIASLSGIKAPSPGAWRLRLWLVDAAGNQNAQTFREATLRWDPDAPTIKLLPRSDDDPTRVMVQATDVTSGIAAAEIEVRRGDDSTWHSLLVEPADEGFTAVIDDEALAPGTYAIRARVRDRAGNEKSADGEPVRLPVRVTTKLAVGKSKRVGANRAGARDRRRVLIRRPRMRYGRTMKLTGRLTTPGGNPLSDRDVEVSQRSRLSDQDWQPVATVRTGASGRFTFKALPGPSRLVRFRYPGTATVQGETSVVDLRVRAGSSLRVSRRHVVNGDAVKFRGVVRGEPLPAVGKLLQLQVYSRGDWLTFATPRADARGNWSHDYRFTATRGVARYRFRVRIPREAGYPYEAGTSKLVKVRVIGL